MIAVMSKKEKEADNLGYIISAKLFGGEPLSHPPRDSQQCCSNAEYSILNTNIISRFFSSQTSVKVQKTIH